MSTILIILLVLLAIGAFTSYPTWGHSQSWGYGPFGGILGLLVVLLIIFYIVGRA